MGASEIETAVTAYWDARAPLFNGAASHVRSATVWRNVLVAAFAADGPKDVIDLGTGTGACALIAASLGHSVRAFDASSAMLGVAREAATAAGLEVTFVQARLSEIPIEQLSADIVTIRNLLWTLERPSEALAIARRALRPGGRLVVSDGLWSHAPDERSDYAADTARALPFHAGLTEADARALLADAGFTDVVAWQQMFKQSPYPGDVPFFVLSAEA